MSDIDESLHVGAKATNIAENGKNEAKTGVQIRRSIDEGLAIWYISQLGIETNELLGSFVSECVDKLDISVIG